jgi:copper chaperone CopZ
MRTLLTSLVGLLAVSTIAMAGEQTLTTKASGNCGSCKKRITKAVEKIDGVQDAAWDKKSKVLTVKFDDTKTNADAIKKAVVAVGHDVEGMKADDKTYEGLPDCCKYRDGDHTH